MRILRVSCPICQELPGNSNGSRSLSTAGISGDLLPIGNRSEGERQKKEGTAKAPKTASGQDSKHEVRILWARSGALAVPNSCSVNSRAFRRPVGSESLR